MCEITFSCNIYVECRRRQNKTWRETQRKSRSEVTFVLNGNIVSATIFYDFTMVGKVLQEFFILNSKRFKSNKDEAKICFQKLVVFKTKTIQFHCHPLEWFGGRKEGIRLDLDISFAVWNGCGVIAWSALVLTCNQYDF